MANNSFCTEASLQDEKIGSGSNVSQKDSSSDPTFIIPESFNGNFAYVPCMSYFSLEVHLSSSLTASGNFKQIIVLELQLIV